MDQTPDQNFKFSGGGSELAFIMFTNILLTIVTLGIYAAWARTNTRRYIWGHTSFQGDRATYTGQGKELFYGWLMVIGIYVGLFIAVTLLQKFISPIAAILLLPVYVYLYSLVIYGGTRYRVSKTSWRGIQFGMDKNKALTREFIFLVFKSSFLSAITLGLYFPVMIHDIRKFLTDKIRFGNVYFKYHGDKKEFCKLFYKGALLSFLTIGLYSPWFHASMLKYRLENTSLEGARFHTGLRGKDLFFFMLGAYFFSIITLGLATPWIFSTALAMIINSVSVVGTINFEEIRNVVSEETGASADVAAVEYDIDLAI